MALTNVADLKTFLGISGSAEDTKLTLILNAVDTCVKEYLGRDIEQATYTDYYTGSGTAFLVLRQRPVLSVTNVWEDTAGNFGDNPSGSFTGSPLVYGVDYVLRRDWAPQGTPTVTASQSRSGMLMRLSGTWQRAPRVYTWGWLTLTPGPLTHEHNPLWGNYKVVYSAGHTTIPDDIKLAVWQVAAYVRMTARMGGYLTVSESLGSYQYQLAQTSIGSAPELGSARAILAKYRELAL